MPRYFMYIPFVSNPGFQFDYKAGDARLDWNKKSEKTGQMKVFEIIYKDTAGTPFHFADGGQDVSIYIRGHGEAGSLGLAPTETSSDIANFARYDDIVKDIIDKGLKQNFSGKIKFYDCHSAERGTGDISFAAKCAGLFRDRGYTSAFFFGYKGDIGGKYKYQGNNKAELLKEEKITLEELNQQGTGQYEKLVQTLQEKKNQHKWVTIMGTKKVVRVSAERETV